jgi:hypothetical protein
VYQAQTFDLLQQFRSPFFLNVTLRHWIINSWIWETILWSQLFRSDIRSIGDDTTTSSLKSETNSPVSQRQIHCESLTTCSLFDFNNFYIYLDSLRLFQTWLVDVVSTFTAHFISYRERDTKVNVPRHPAQFLYFLLHVRNTERKIVTKNTFT